MAAGLVAIVISKLVGLTGIADVDCWSVFYI